MAVPIGQKLRKVRLARGLELEDVQHRTRIPKSLLVAMENDDLGAFPNQTYARKFFAAYARHLGVEVTGFLSLFQPHGLGGVMEFHPYLRPATDHTGPAKSPSQHRIGYASAAILGVSLLALALAAALAIWTGLRDRQLGSTVATQTAVKPSSTQTKTRPPGEPTTAAPPAVQPRQLPVLRAEPVDDASATSATGAASATGDQTPDKAANLPLVETPGRQPADAPAR